MRWLAHVHAEHGDTLPATLRERFGVSLWDVGDTVSWREGLALTRAAMQDTSTSLGASAAGWSYPATEVQLLTLAGMFGKAAARILPFDMDEGGRATSQELEEAQAALDEGIKFAN